MEEVTKVKSLSEGTGYMHNDISLVNLMFFPCLQVTLVNFSVLKIIWEGKKKERESDLAAVLMQSRSHYFLNKVEFYSS